MKNLRRAAGGALALTLLVGAGVAGGGCYGNFRLTTKLWDWNTKAANERWGREAIFLITSPVYGLTACVDAVVLNAVEFWTGSNPMGDDKKKKFEMARIDRREGMMAATDEPGRTLLIARGTADGGVVVADASGQTVRTYSPEDVRRTVRAALR